MDTSGLSKLNIEGQESEVVTFEIDLDKVSGRGEVLFHLPAALIPVNWTLFCFIYNPFFFLLIRFTYIMKNFGIVFLRLEKRRDTLPLGNMKCFVVNNFEPL